jgi:hypothetical protein
VVTRSGSNWQLHLFLQDELDQIPFDSGIRYFDSRVIADVNNSGPS